MLIGMCGAMHAGKSTAAKHLVDHYGYHRMRFAGPIKAMMKCLGLTDEEIDGGLKNTPCAKLGGQTPRFAMQTLGTEWGRNTIWDNLWLDACRREVEVALEAGGFVVIDDVRFPNEARMIKDRGGLLISVQRPGTGGLSSHASETQELHPDITIVNDTTIRHLKREIDWIADSITSEASFLRATRTVA